VRCVPMSVRRPSVVHPVVIWKTKQDRSIVIMKHYIEFGTPDSVAAFRSSSDQNLPCGDSGFCRHAVSVRVCVYHVRGLCQNE